MTLHIRQVLIHTIWVRVGYSHCIFYKYICAFVMKEICWMLWMFYQAWCSFYILHALITYSSLRFQRPCFFSIYFIPILNPFVQFSGTNSHHIIEATFKAFARALRQATEYDTRRRGTIPRCSISKTNFFVFFSKFCMKMIVIRLYALCCQCYGKIIYIFPPRYFITTRWCLCSCIECSIPCSYSADWIIDFTSWKKNNNTPTVMFK